MSLVGIHTLVLLPDAEAAYFEKFMQAQAFPIAAEVPGSMSRGGVSAIRSQHLLRSAGDGEYLWIVKYSGGMSAGLFPDIVHNMYESVRPQAETFATLKSSIVYEIVDSFDLGPRSSLGRPLGEPVRGAVL
jgi:hypothetical protein